MSFVFDSKTPSDAITLSFDFSAGLATGETLSGTPTVTATVAFGTDATPSGLLNGSASLAPGAKAVNVPVHAGVAGVDYLLTVVCSTTTPSKVLTLYAVLPVRAADPGYILPLNLLQLRNLFRTMGDDRAQKYRWDATDLDAYFNEAQVEACWRASLLVDASWAGNVASAYSTVNTVAGQSLYDLDNRVIFVRRVSLGSTRIAPADVTDLDRIDQSWQTRTGTVERFVIGQDVPGKRKLRLYRQPTVDAIAYLTIVREPLTKMVADGDYPEIPSRYHEKLLDWVAYRAYSNFDSDTYNPELAKEHLARFEGVFGTKEDNAAREASMLKATANLFSYEDGTW